MAVIRGASHDQEVLFEFLRMPLGGTDEVFAKFKSLDGAVPRGRNQARFVYVPGRREDRVLLVAHADTAWSGQTPGPGPKRGEPFEVADGVVMSSRAGVGLGADDRAGCAILWLLRNLGHSLLITDGEESGGHGANFLATAMENADIAGAINQDHGFAVEFDRRNGRDYKCYEVGTPDFRRYIAEVTGYTEPDRSSFTDIVALCTQVPGVNLSFGFQMEHSAGESLDLAKWQNTLDICRGWLSSSWLPHFKL